jgi:hypothetical protein
MKLPFKQLPELKSGHGLLVGAPSAGGRTFFLTNLARSALSQELKVCFLGYAEGSAWVWDLLQNDFKELTFIDLYGMRFDLATFDKLIAASLTADLLIVDGIDTMVYVATGGLNPITNPRTAAGEVLTRILQKSIKAITTTGTRMAFGVTINRSNEVGAPNVPEGADSWSYGTGVKNMHVIPVAEEHQLIDNLTTVRLVKEFR